MMKRILFIDDEINILRGIQRSLRARRDEWETKFVTGGREALAALNDSRFDAIVTDMRMPGMHGSTLLQEVASLYPWTIRLILSGEAEKDLLFGAVPTSHQFLPKPCDTLVLQQKLDRAFRYGDRIDSIAWRELASAIRNIPSPESTVQDFRNALFANEPDIEEIGKIASLDPAIGGRLLQLANSAYFGIGTAVTGVRNAAVLLGVDLMRRLVEEKCIAVSCSTGPFSARCIAAARLGATLSAGAAELAEDVGFAPHEREAVATAALLLPLGLIAPSPTCDLSDGSQLPMGFEAVSAYLSVLWGLPEPVTRLIAAVHPVRDRIDFACSPTLVAATLVTAALSMLGKSLSDAEAEIVQRLGGQDFVRLQMDEPKDQAADPRPARN